MHQSDRNELARLIEPEHDLPPDATELLSPLCVRFLAWQQLCALRAQQRELRVARLRKRMIGEME